MSHVLVIDDSELARDKVKQMLASAGFAVTVAADGKDGLEQFRRERFDLVICGVVTRRKDGPATIARIRAMAPGLPIIAMTGGGATSAPPVPGATGAIAEPFSRDDLLGAIRVCMMEKTTRFFE